MIVKDLIKLLSDMPLEAAVVVDIDTDINNAAFADITHLTKHVNYENKPVVVIDAKWGGTKGKS